MSAAEQHKHAQSMYTENQTLALLQHYYKSTLKTQFLTFVKIKAKMEWYLLFLHLICLKYIVIIAFSSCVSAASVYDCVDQLCVVLLHRKNQLWSHKPSILVQDLDSDHKNDLLIFSFTFFFIK